ncbi:MAG TPA: riboflavin synthase [bacterium]|mgnify:CR=1 FL=1|nr:riboflavin synthase [bacterium]HQG47150.1 riboflavin synthase [bacterium]HQI47201.1 riboflavin synthase [bacterium]HQJ65173.1 riboflavin synthase [bacterium]
MFTGLIEEIGRVAAISPLGEGRRIEITAARVLEGLAAGDSVAVNGVCLTVIGQGERTFAVEAVAESLTRTTLKNLMIGEEVNLERALLATGRLGGHFVQGHVDGEGEVIALEPRNPGFWLRIRVPRELAPLMVEKGSITIDGVSLTIAAVEGELISIALIPHSAQRTTLGYKRSGSRVNLEADIIGKYVQRLLAGRGTAPGSLTGERLQDWGY